MTIQQAIMNLYEIDVQIRDTLTALADYAIEKPFGLSSLQIDEKEITKSKQNIMNGYTPLTYYFVNVLHDTLNEWEITFVEWLDLTEFSLCRDNAGYYLENLQDVNLGDINKDRFDNAKQIFERMGIYIEDYFNRSLSDCAYELGIETDVHSLSDWIKYKEQLNDNTWDIDAVDMICNHAQEIDLSKVLIYLSAR